MNCVTSTLIIVALAMLALFTVVAQADPLNQCVYAADAGRTAAIQRDQGVLEGDSVEMLQVSHPELEEGAIVELVREVNETNWTPEQVSHDIFGQCMLFDKVQQ